MRDKCGVKAGPQSPRAVKALFALMAMLGLSACILFVDPSTDLGGTCHIRGETTACGACIATKCRTQLDACCGDGSCATILDTIDTCVADSTQAACPLVFFKPAVVSSTMDKLRQCTSDCAATCNAATGTSSGTSGTSGGGPFATGCSSFISSECDCSGDLPPSSVACSTDSLGSGVCCADYGWPNTGLRCDCKAYRCKDTATGCICGTSVSGPNQSCTGTYCCLFEGTCTCGTTKCSNVSTPVASCTAATTDCVSSSQRHVPSCSLRPGETLPPLDGGKG